MVCFRLSVKHIQSTLKTSSVFEEYVTFKLYGVPMTDTKPFSGVEHKNRIEESEVPVANSVGKM